MTAQDRAPLSRERVVTVALRLVDRRGSAALTMRNVAAELGVQAMSLYHHVRNREDLLDGMADLLVESELPIPGPGDSWERALRGFCAGIRATAQHHPEAFALVGLRPLRSERALRPVLALLDRLLDAGLGEDEAVVAYRNAAAYARGFALAEIAGLTLGAPTTTAPPPRLRAALQRDPDAVFAEGIELLVAGVAARRGAARPAGTAHSASPAAERGVGSETSRRMA